MRGLGAAWAGESFSSIPEGDASAWAVKGPGLLAGAHGALRSALRKGIGREWLEQFRRTGSDVVVLFDLYPRAA